MDAITAYRAIINLLDGNKEAYKSVLSDYKGDVDVWYYHSKNKRVRGKLDTNRRLVRLPGGQVIKCRH